MQYIEILFIEADANFEELGHKGKAVRYIFVPLKRKQEFLASSGYKALFPVGQILYYE